MQARPPLMRSHTLMTVQHHENVFLFLSLCFTGEARKQNSQIQNHTKPEIRLENLGTKDKQVEALKHQIPTYKHYTMPAVLIFSCSAKCFSRSRGVCRHGDRGGEAVLQRERPLHEAERLPQRLPQEDRQDAPELRRHNPALYPHRVSS